MFKTTGDSISVTKFPFASWTNMFDSNVSIGDEIKYVMDRQNQENMMGNTLEKPSLLNKKNFIRDTTVEEEKVKTAGKNA